MAILNSLINTGESRLLGKVYMNDLDISNDLIIKGKIETEDYINIGKNTAANALIYLNNKLAIQGKDAWLRINEKVNNAQPFSSGVYFGDSIVRTDGKFQIGNGGANIEISSSAATFKVPTTITSTLNVNGDTTFNKAIITTANIDTANIQNVNVYDTLRAAKYSIETVQNLGGHFLVCPTIEVPSQGNESSFSCQVTRPSSTSNALTIAFTDNSLATDTFNGTTWTANSKVKVSGMINNIAIGTCDGTITSWNKSTKVVTVSVVCGTDISSKFSTTATAYTSAQVSNLSIMMYEVYTNNTTYPIGIYLTAYGNNKYSYIDVYGGTSAKPTTRMGKLDGLDAVNGTSPTGWGFYSAQNGYFQGTIVSSAGKIGGFNIGDSAIYSVANSIASTSNNIYIGTEGISLGTVFKVTKAGALTATSGSIGGWALSTNSLATGTWGANNSAMLCTGTAGSKAIGGSDSISGWVFTAGANFGVTKTGALYANSAHISGEITATSGTIGGCNIVDGLLSVPAANITGTLSADRIGANTLTIGKFVTDDQEKILNENIQIGGRNLLPLSQFIPYNLGPDIVETDGYIADSSPNSDGRSRTYAQSNWHLYLEHGTYMLSWDVETITSSTSQIIQCFKADGTSVFTVGVNAFATLGKHTKTFTISEDGQYGLMFKVYTARVRFKLEKGNIATAWTPAPEDQEQGKVWYAECDTAAGMVNKEATITPTTSNFRLVQGTTINVKIANTNSGAVGSLTLNVNNTGAKNIKYINNTGIANIPDVNYLVGGRTYQFIYDGTYWVITNMNYNTNTNYYDRRQHNQWIKAAAAITKAHIVAGTDAGYKMLAANLAFDLSYPILYSNVAISADAQGYDVYEAIPSINISTTGTVEGLAVNKIVYLKGSLSGNTFTIASSNWLTCTPTADSYYYIPLGMVANDATTKMYFSTSDKLYAYINGVFQRVDKGAAAIATATKQYFWYDEDGAHIGTVAENGNSNYNSLWNSNGLLLRKNENNLAAFTDSTVQFYDGTGNADSNIVAKFGGDNTKIGKINDIHLEMDYHSLQLIDKEDNSYFYVSDLRNTQGEMTETFTGDGNTQTFFCMVRIASVSFVSINGVETSAYTFSGMGVSFTTTPADGAEIVVKYLPTETEKGRLKAYTFGIRGSGKVGAMSVAEGLNTVASGLLSHAEGSATNAQKDYSHAEGRSTTASYGAHAEGGHTNAYSDYAHAEGYYTEAAQYAHAEGSYTTASAAEAHAEGASTTASAQAAHAEGYNTTASSIYSHAEGDSTTASAAEAHAEGRSTTASGMDSHAEGYLTTASESFSHAEGHNTAANGYGSHAEGISTIANGNYSHAQGGFTIASQEYQTVMGKYNKESTVSDNFAVILGNGTGTASNERSNALTVDWSGNIVSSGSGTFGGAISGTTGTFTGAISGASLSTTGSISGGAISGTTGTFTSNISAVKGTFSGAVTGASYSGGAISGTTGSFTGNVTHSANILPDKTNTRYLGTSDLRWQNLYSHYVNASATVTAGAVTSYTPSWKTNQDPVRYHCVVSAGICSFFFMGNGVAHTQGTVICTLPEGARPSSQVNAPFVKMSGNVVGVITITSAGEVSVGFISNTTSTGRIYFNCTYPVV